MSSTIADSIDFTNDPEFQGLREATDFETRQFLYDDSGEVLVDRWMIYDRVFPDGQREICASKFTTIKQNGPLPMPNRARRGESEKRDANREDSAKRARQAVRLRAKAIAADRLLTLTYTDNMQDVERLKRDWKAFVRRMSKYKQFHYVACIEKQARGAYHIHVAIHGRQLYQLVRSIWRSVVGPAADGRPGGNIDVRNPERLGYGNIDVHKLAAYISKYIGKDLGDHDLNKKNYWSSRGVVIPQKNYYQLPLGANAYDAFCHVMQMAADHNNAGMAFFSNEPLGVCWVATGPTG